MPMFPALLLLWFLFAGSFTLTNLIIGTLVCALVTLLCTKFMGYSTRRFYGLFRKTGKVISYFLNLLKEIVLSNINVLKVIWGKTPDPLLVRFGCSLKSELLQVLVANSITLTPGTITVELENGQYLVHALDKPFADGIEECDFFTRAAELEG